MQPQTNYTPVFAASQTDTAGQGSITDALSIQAKLELRQRKLGHLAYTLDRIYTTGIDLSEPVTLPYLATITGLRYMAIYKDFAKGTEFITKMTPSENITQEGDKKVKNYREGKKADLYCLPDPQEIDNRLGIAEPLYLTSCRVDTYTNYKADVSQIPVANTKPGELSSWELADQAHVSKRTSSRHRKQAGVTSIKKPQRTHADRAQMPENYAEFLSLVKRFEKHTEGKKSKPVKIGDTAILPSLHLEYQGNNYAYTQRSYDRLIADGAEPSAIYAVYYKNSHHYARVGMTIKAPKYNKYTAPSFEHKKYYYVPEVGEPEAEEQSPAVVEFISLTAKATAGQVYVDKFGRELCPPPARPSKVQEILEKRYGKTLALAFMEAK